jgi:LacI family transcriptional regulator
MGMISASEDLSGLSQDPVTLLDVARRAGVSSATVSRILNGNATVGAKRRKAVEDAIAQLNFQPNLFARSLKTGITMTVGVLTQAIESPFYAWALKGIEAGLQGTGHSPLIVSGHWDAANDMASLRLLTSRRVDGLIILTGLMSDDEVINLARAQPVVITERTLSAPNVHSIKLDQKRGGYLATQHLLSLGHTRIAHISGIPHRSDSIERYQGYLQAHQEACIIPDAQLCVQGDFTQVGGRLSMLRLLESGHPFTAVFCSNDETAFGARLALHQLGLQVPQDMSLVGFDDLPISSYATPPLTTVHQPVYELGLYAAHKALAMMGYAAQEVSVPPLQLMVRETTRRL